MNQQATMGGRIKYLLKQRHMTQRDLARTLYAQEPTISRYVRDIRMPDGVMLTEIALALHTTPNYLLGIGIEFDTVTAEYTRMCDFLKEHSRELSDEQKKELVCLLFK